MPWSVALLFGWNESNFTIIRVIEIVQVDYASMFNWIYVF